MAHNLLLYHQISPCARCSEEKLAQATAEREEQAARNDGPDDCCASEKCPDEKGILLYNY